MLARGNPFVHVSGENPGAFAPATRASERRAGLRIEPPGRWKILRFPEIEKRLLGVGAEPAVDPTRVVTEIPQVELRRAHGQVRHGSGRVSRMRKRELLIVSVPLEVYSVIAAREGGPVVLFAQPGSQNNTS